MATETVQNLDYSHLEPIPNKYGFGIIACSMSFFVFLNILVSSRSHPKSIDPADAWKWRNLFISWIHALIVGTWDILCFVLYPELTTDLIDYHNFFLYSMVAFSTGYFFYDFLDIIRRNGSNSSWEILLHHLAVSSMFFFNIIQSRCISYNVVALMAEINSFFLHSRKLMQMHKVPFDNIVYRVNVYLNLASFVIGRFLSLAWIVYGMFNWYHRVHFIYMCCLSVAIVVMWGINLVLFHRLISNDILRKYVPEYRLKISNGVDHSTANNNGLTANHNNVGNSCHNNVKNRLVNGYKTS